MPAPPDGETLAYAAVLAVLEGVDADALASAMEDDGEDGEEAEEDEPPVRESVGPPPYPGAVFNAASHRWCAARRLPEILDSQLEIFRALKFVFFERIGEIDGVLFLGQQRFPLR